MTKGCRNDEVSDGIAPPRHSRAGGNPVCSVSVVFGFRVIFKSSFPRKWESSLVGTEIYWIKRFLQPYALDSRFRGNDEELRE